jgi:hypothetical protein
MNDGESNTTWQELLDEVMAETDKAKLKQKADDLESALFQRSQELQLDGGTDVERNALSAALRKLLQVRVEKLDFPMDRTLLRSGTRESQ